MLLGKADKENKGDLKTGKDESHKMQLVNSSIEIA